MLRASDPVIVTLPVNWCVLVSCVPNLVDPVTKSTDDVIVCTTRVCAVIVLLTRRFDAVAFCLITKLSADDAVAANDALTALSTNEAVVALSAQLEVPNKDPVIPADTLREPVII